MNESERAGSRNARSDVECDRAVGDRRGSCPTSRMCRRSVPVPGELNELTDLEAFGQEAAPAGPPGQRDRAARDRHIAREHRLGALSADRAKADPPADRDVGLAIGDQRDRHRRGRAARDRGRSLGQPHAVARSGTRLSARIVGALRDDHPGRCLHDTAGLLGAQHLDDDRVVERADRRRLDVFGRERRRRVDLGCDERVVRVEAILERRRVDRHDDRHVPVRRAERDRVATRSRAERRAARGRHHAEARVGACRPREAHVVVECSGGCAVDVECHIRHWLRSEADLEVVGDLGRRGSLEDRVRRVP